ncbi:zinc-binding dehydrogenase [Actinokineospora sp. PR83]|uniref:zinc-binding dehydrogenase n=1 Tax=Actinokineospora sp. PR83 TaxID=2884908 RepID=UPI0027E19020|nr:zinc-binding dehydrogenase [Actinokineospora sp. PR83]MCG8916369.1 zinc-binding dehydrogenase [Actinokineospora sp. PR83]
MRVVRAVRFGGPEVLEPGWAPDPEPGAGQVVVAVAVAAVDFVQTQLRRGVTPGPPLPTPPYVPGRSIAGVVVSVGAGVDPGWVGRRVVGHTASGWDGNAESAVAALDALVEVPPGVELTTAAALLDDGSTALGLVEAAGVAAGEWVLVEAAAGGVGTLLVQLVRAAGARVVGAARGRLKLDLVTGLGAEAVVDYGEPGWTDRVRAATGGRGPDLVFDGVGGAIGRAAFEATARGGRFSAHGAASGSATLVDPAEAAERGVRVLGVEQLYGFRSGSLDRVRRLLADPRVRPVIGQAVPLADAAAAHAAMEARTVLGKTLLIVREE